MNVKLISGAVFFVLALSCLKAHAVDKGPLKERPNIIIIYCDDMGYGDLSINGHPWIKTPNIDGMAMQGMRFSNYYSASPACTASRYSLLTGRYPIRSGFRWVLSPDSEMGIHPQEQTLAEVLKARGYGTAIFGKWHLGSTRKEYLPLQNGFDEYVGLPYSNDMIPPKYPEIALMNGNDTLEMGPDQSKLTALYTEKAVDFVRRQKDRPFFLYLPYAMPHVPLHPGKEFVGSSKRGPYGDAVQEIDFYVGELLKALKDEKLDKNTIVWFLSDNGPWILKNQEGGSAGLFRDGKGSTWEGGMRVPCIVWGLDRIEPGKIDTKSVNAMDIYATCIKLAGGNIPSDRPVDGIDVSSFLAAGSTADRKQEVPFFYYGIDHKLLAVRKGKWKLHVHTYSQLGLEYFAGKLPLLFDLHQDPSEKYDLAGQYPEMVAELNALIEIHQEKTKKEGTFWSSNPL